MAFDKRMYIGVVDYILEEINKNSKKIYKSNKICKNKKICKSNKICKSKKVCKSKKY
jgi:hypothetical protein